MTTPVWNAEQYLKFADHRLRPGLELAARVPIAAPRIVCDLGCGAGNLTAELSRRWQGARIIGVDNSPEMLAKARAIPGIEWREGDVRRWTPETPPDIVYSNAVLHWVERHDTLLARLMGCLAPGGALAVQMPRNHAAPSHVGLQETAREGPWRARLAPLLGPAPVESPGYYYDLLAPLAAGVDIWETEYQQVLEGEDAVVEWTRGTALKPFLDALGPDERPAFLDAYRRRMAAAYPRRADGTTLFAFKRLFIVALSAINTR